MWILDFQWLGDAVYLARVFIFFLSYKEEGISRSGSSFRSSSVPKTDTSFVKEALKLSDNL